MCQIRQFLHSMQRSVSEMYCKWKKIQTCVLADFREILTLSTAPSEQQSRQTLTEFDDVYTSAVSPGASSLIGLVWLSNWQNTANSTVLLMWCVMCATPEPWTTTSLGTNDSVVTGHAWAHSRQDTGGNDGFTAWQIRIRSLERRLRLLAVLWHWC